MNDIRWLVSPAAHRWLQIADEESARLTALASRLRKELTAERTSLVLSQSALRRKAHGKFDQAARMYFTEVGLQQASHQAIARYKATLFAGAERVADMCCGIGGDTVALGQASHVTGVDRDPISTTFAKANAEANGCLDVTTLCVDVASMDPADYHAWHIDPDRRPMGGRRRTVHVAWQEPDGETIQKLIDRNEHALIKLAPAAELPTTWQLRASCSWIGFGRQCHQMLARFGRFRSDRSDRSAVVVDANGNVLGSVHGDGQEQTGIAAQVGHFVVEPHAAVLAAQLSDAVALKHQLESLSPGGGYLTSRGAVEDPLLSVFQVTEVMPLDLKKIKKHLRASGIGHVTVKKRGTDHEPSAVAKQLQGNGERSATLLLTRFHGKAIAIVANRVSQIREPR